MEPDIDRMGEVLSEALKRYSAVEPRLGLEKRVRARLQAEAEKLSRRNWWRFVAAATSAAAFGIVGLLSVRLARTPVISIAVEATQKSAATKDTKSPIDPLESQKVKPSNAKRPAAGGAHYPEVEERGKVEHREEALPRLGQFPSPRPLSEEERRLAGYVDEHRDHALLVARAQTALSKMERQREGLVKTDSLPEWSTDESNP
jgi:hypothetical protein